MNRSVEQALVSLVPALNDSLPAPLIELAGSLLAQSRHRASTLKAEEEIARAYACAHIACERLKTSLDLPLITPRPPIPPRIYKRLYTHLDKILPSTVPGLKTPSKKHGTPSKLGSTPGTGRSLRGTPTLAQLRGQQDIGNRTPSKSTGKATSFVAAGTSLPPWIHPTIRFVCTSQWGGQELVPTILAGIETIAAPAGRKSKDVWVNDNMAPLLAAIALFVRTQERVPKNGNELQETEFNLAQKEVLKGLQMARKEVSVRGMDEEDAWEGWEAVSKKSLEAAIVMVMEKQWLESDWYTSLKSVIEGSEDFYDQIDDGDGDDPGDLRVGKADSMLQERWIWTEKRNEEYNAWKESILRRIDGLEKAGKGIDGGVDYRADAMDVEMADAS